MSQRTLCRREFLHTSTGAALAAMVPLRRGRGTQSPRGGTATNNSVLAGVTPLRDPQVKTLALSALDAAKSAGARYADVRLTCMWTRVYNGNAAEDTVELGLSVRALVDGFWGWAARPDLTTEAGPWVGREAVRLAKANAASGKLRRVEWNVVPPVQDGDWTTPITIDPFEVSVQEMIDSMEGLCDYVFDFGKQRGYRAEMSIPNTPVHQIRFYKQDRVFASTEGSYLTQTLYFTDPQVDFLYRDRDGNAAPSGAVQAGYEFILTQQYRERIRQEMDRIDEQIKHDLPNKPLDVGRYDVVFSAQAMAILLSSTLGPATELDRALGYEANTVGTSYLGPDPLTLLGTSIASPLVTVTANRSAPLGLATVHWDDEGIVPEDFTLVNRGVLVDYQTTREQAAWIAPWYQKQGVPIRSHGCAAARSALTVQMQHTPNLALQPGTANVGMEELVASLEHGFIVEELTGRAVRMDFQQLNGLAFLGEVTEVRKGRRIARLGEPAALLFHTPEFWKNIAAIGGPQSQIVHPGKVSWKGEPGQGTTYSVAAVPAIVQQLAFITPAHKA